MVYTAKNRESQFFILAKSSILNIWQGFEYASVYQEKKDLICQFQSLHIPMLNIGIQFLLKWYRNLIFWELVAILRHRKSKTVSLFRKIRGLSRTMSDICDGVFCKNILRLKTFFAKIFIIYIWQGPKNVSDYPTKKNSSTAWKVSIFGVSLVRIFPQSD